MEPSVSYLLEIAQWFFKQADMVGMKWIMKSKWLYHIDSFFKCVLKESIRYFKLTKRPVRGNGNGKNKVMVVGLIIGLKGLV